MGTWCSKKKSGKRCIQPGLKFSWIQEYRQTGSGKCLSDARKSSNYDFPKDFKNKRVAKKKRLFDYEGGDKPIESVKRRANARGDTIGHSGIQVLYDVLNISFHICCNPASSLFKLVGCPTRRPKRYQICSIGDKSGDRTGQGRAVTVWRQSCDTLAIRGRALSC
ncbi:hypothetical protein TNCV_3462211 [Trichonephila clavipes]|nr:hypothetical protein TNCV_3462211 [Trichonephila clavipes]